MSNTTIQSIRDCFHFVSKKYNELQENTIQPDRYRIIDIIPTASNKKILIVQIIGKATVFKCSPKEIIGNQNFLEGFSKKDISKIYQLDKEIIPQPKYKILVNEFSSKLNRMLLKIINSENNTPVEKTADEITLDRDFLSQLNPNDAHVRRQSSSPTGVN